MIYPGQTIQISKAFKCLVIFNVFIDYIKQKAQTYIHVRRVANVWGDILSQTHLIFKILNFPIATRLLKESSEQKVCGEKTVNLRN